MEMPKMYQSRFATISFTSRKLGRMEQYIKTDEPNQLSMIVKIHDEIKQTCNRLLVNDYPDYTLISADVHYDGAGAFTIECELILLPLKGYVFTQGVSNGA